MKYRKKPVVIEAIQFWNGDKDKDSSIEKCSEFVGKQGQLDESPSGDCTLYIETLEGGLTAQNGDWIIKGIKGEFYPCKPDIFKMTYEKVN